MTLTNEGKDKLIEWIASGDTGASSKCLANAMCALPHDGSYPMDSGDFGRCLRLLDAVPELRGRLNAMRGINEYWNALIENWALLEACYREESGDKEYSQNTSKLMSKILRPIEDKDKNFVRLGPSCSLRFK